MKDQPEYQFPTYRKYPDGKSFFRILSDEAFEEVQVFGKFYSIYTIKAAIYPDRLRIMDMLACVEEKWEITDEKAFNSFLENCQNSLKRTG